MENVRSIVEYVLPQWPGLVVLVVLWLVGAFMAAKVFPRGSKSWGRNTLTIQPIVAGAILGCFWTSPAPGIVGYTSIAYFAGWGALSVLGYQIAKPWLKSKGINLSQLPGLESQYPTLPPDPKVPSELKEP